MFSPGSGTMVILLVLALPLVSMTMTGRLEMRRFCAMTAGPVAGGRITVTGPAAFTSITVTLAGTVEGPGVFTTATLRKGAFVLPRPGPSATVIHCLGNPP